MANSNRLSKTLTIYITWIQEQTLKLNIKRNPHG